jgi:hypothetical protein
MKPALSKSEKKHNLIPYLPARPTHAHIRPQTWRTAACPYPPVPPAQPLGRHRLHGPHAVRNVPLAPRSNSLRAAGPITRPLLAISSSREPPPAISNNLQAFSNSVSWMHMKSSLAERERKRGEREQLENAGRGIA